MIVVIIVITVFSSSSSNSSSSSSSSSSSNYNNATYVVPSLPQGHRRFIGAGSTSVAGAGPLLYRESMSSALVSILADTDDN